METQPEGTVVPESPVIQEPVQASAVVQEAPPPVRKKSVVGKVLVGLLILILAGAAVGLGTWGNDLDAQLAGTKTQLTELQGQYEQLQGDHDKLKGDSETLTADLAQTKTDLEPASGELTKTQDSLAEEQEKATTVQANINDTSKLMDVVIAVFVNDENEHGVEAKVKATGDSKLISLWAYFMKKKHAESVDAFVIYLFETIAANLGK